MTITLQYKYIKHDIDQWTYRMAKVRVENEDIRNEAQSSSVSTDESFYRRKIVEAIAHIRTMLKNRLSTVKNGTGNDTLSLNAASWQITLSDDSYSCDAQAMSDLMHKYIVRSVITEWALTYAPDAVASVTAETEGLKQQILTEAYNRKYPVLSENHSVTLSANPTEGGTVAGGGSFANGELANITATAASGYTFTSWSDGSTNASRTIGVVSNLNLIANFTQNQ